MNNFIPLIKCLLFTLLLVLFLSACSTSISRLELQKMQQQSPPPLVVDVRSEGEFNADHIPGAIHIPFYSIGSGLGMRLFPKDKPVVLYCEHAPRAGLAGIILFFQGYEKVYSLEGHMKGWRESGLPVEMKTIAQ